MKTSGEVFRFTIGFNTAIIRLNSFWNVCPVIIASGTITLGAG